MRLDPIEDNLSSCLRFLQACLRVQSLERELEPSIRVVVWQVCASWLALAHTILGTMILSSLIFVGFHDTLVILTRFLLSALVSRLIVLLQLNMMRDRVDDAPAVDGGSRSYEDSGFSADLSLEQIGGLDESWSPTRPT